MAGHQVLLDTDIGEDIDDAVCLAYLLRQPACELVGITTVTGDTQKRAALAGAICAADGQEQVSIHAGAPGPMLFGHGPIPVSQYEAIADRPHRRDYPGDALEFMRTTIRDRPGQVTLLAIGPMTNVALLFAADPQIPGLLKELVVMGGTYSASSGHGPGTLDYNAVVDPIATAMVFAARPPRFTCIGMDMTTQCTMAVDVCQRRFAEIGGPLQLVADMAGIWFRRRPVITFHDPLAAAVLFEPGLCDFQQGRVSIEVTSRELAGLTRFAPKADDAPHRVATAVRPDAFFEHYFQTVADAVHT